MDSEAKISRRKMLRNVGIAGAMAWTAPVLSSLGSPAFASVQSRHNKTCRDFVLQDPANGACGVCNINSVGCENNGGCFCIVNVKGCCFCTQGASCASLIPCPQGQFQCPTGQQCVPQTCCNTGQVCVPPCGGAPQVPRRAGRTTHPR